eukprot:scaffold16504_cov105-Isochrysis_galbana.AAC.5
MGRCALAKALAWPLPPDPPPTRPPTCTRRGTAPAAPLPPAGQLEITAIAHATRRAVVVFSADAPELLTGAEYEANGPRLKLAYHRHYYGLGEHYNSLVPIH